MPNQAAARCPALGEIAQKVAGTRYYLMAQKNNMPLDEVVQKY